MEEETTVAKVKVNENYDPFKREPLFSNADNSCLWEISILKSHYHPTVRKFVEILMSKKP